MFNNYLATQNFAYSIQTRFFDCVRVNRVCILTSLS